MIFCVMQLAVTITVIIISAKERKRLIELLAAKDYADYKNFEEKPDEPREQTNMFRAREAKIKKREELR